MSKHHSKPNMRREHVPAIASTPALGADPTAGLSAASDAGDDLATPPADPEEEGANDAAPEESAAAVSKLQASVDDLIATEVAIMKCRELVIKVPLGPLADASLHKASHIQLQFRSEKTRPLKTLVRRLQDTLQRKGVLMPYSTPRRVVSSASDVMTWLLVQIAEADKQGDVAAPDA